MKHRSYAAVLILGAAVAGGAHAQGSASSKPGEGGTTVYRCPGPPVLYTDALTAKEAQERGCRTIEGTPITIVQLPKPRPAASSARNGDAKGDGKVDATAQRQRDADARRILEDELRREQDKLAELQREYNNGQPERRGNERNYQTYLDRVASLKAAITRSESDIAAIKRELAKIQP